MEEAAVLGRLQRLCSRTEYCRSDVYRKALKALDNDPEAASRVVTSLVDDRFVDDARYASAFAREKAALQGWGTVKIRYQLAAKGIPAAVIGEALAEIDAEKASARLDRLVAAKSRALHGDPQAKLKLLKHILGRGYSYEEAEAALSRIKSSEP